MTDPIVTDRNIGWRTTEWWISALVSLAGIVLASGLPADHVVMRVAAMAMSAATALGYTVSRASLKKAAIQPQAEPGRARRVSATITQD